MSKVLSGESCFEGFILDSGSSEYFIAEDMADTSRRMDKFGNFEAEEALETELSLISPRSFLSLSLGRGVHGMRGIQDGDKLEDSYSLDLSLGCAPESSKDGAAAASSGCVVSSARGTCYKNVTDGDLEYHLIMVNDPIPYEKIMSEEKEMRPLELDLTLSLSTGPSKSVITSSVSMCSPQLRDNKEIGATSCIATVQLVDEGSTSGMWNVEHLGPPLVVEQALSSVGLPSSCGDIDSPGVAARTLPAMLSTPNDVVAGMETIQKSQKQKSRICQVPGCGKGARGASGRCISHGGGRRCERVGCLKGAEGRTVFCKAHGGGRRCEHLGCTKAAEGRTDFCISHGGGRRCSHNGCTHASRGKSGLCIRHGGGKRCQKENCSKSAEGSSGFCIAHGGGRRCQKLGCTKGAQGSTMFCKGHGGGRRCTALGCTKGAEGSTQFCKAHGGGKRCAYEGGGVCPKSVHGGTSYCVRHGGGKRCATPGCAKSARGKTSHCVRHGGGKRCQQEGCTKSAQGSTDFCKSHGGGKRCSWVQLSSVTNGQASGSCDKFTRGKSDLCALHDTLSRDKRVHGGDLLGPILPNLETIPSKKMRETISKETLPASERKTAGDLTYVSVDGFPPGVYSPVNVANVSQCTVPEGRVHGGNFMKLLKDNLGLIP